MTVPVVVAIPYKDRPELTCALVDQLHRFGGWDWLLLYDNGSTSDTHRQVMAVLDRYAEAQPTARRQRAVRYLPGWTLTAMWNDAWTTAEGIVGPDGEADLAILNNDLDVPDGFLQRMSQELRSDDDLWMVAPDWRIAHPANQPGQVERVNGTYRHGGIHGSAFMVRVEARRMGLPAIDEQFEWWAGDDDLVFSILKAGHAVGRIGGLGFCHVGGGSQTFTDAHHLKEQAHDDLRRCQEKWGR